MADESIKFQTSGAVGIITLDRPESRNALTPDLIGALDQAVAACAAPHIRAVLLTGAGGAFCAGADVKQLADTLRSPSPA